MDNTKKHAFKDLFKLLALCLAGAAAAATVSVIIILIISFSVPSFTDNLSQAGLHSNRPLFLALQVITQLFMFALPPFFIWKVSKKQVLKNIGVLRTSWKSYVFAVAAIFFTSYVMVYLSGLSMKIDWNGISPAIGTYIENSNASRVASLEALLGERTELNFIIALFVVGLCPAVCEEIFFRGAVQKIALGLFPVHLAILFTALVFTLAHFDFHNFLPMLALSLTLGYLRYYSGSIWPSMSIHFGNNVFTVFSVFYSGESLDPALAETENVPFWLFLLSLASIAAIFILMKKLSGTLLKSKL